MRLMRAIFNSAAWLPPESTFSRLRWALTAVVGHAHKRGRPPHQAPRDAQAAALGLVRHPVVHDAHLRTLAACARQPARVTP